MPYIHIATTRTLTRQAKDELHQCALNAADRLHKPRHVVMVCIVDGSTLQKGEEQSDCAFCDVRVVGTADAQDCDAFSAILSADIARIAGTAPGCVYLSISGLSLCYTDGCLPPGHET